MFLSLYHVFIPFYVYFPTMLNQPWTHRVTRLRLEQWTGESKQNNRGSNLRSSCQSQQASDITALPSVAGTPRSPLPRCVMVLVSGASDGRPAWAAGRPPGDACCWLPDFSSPSHSWVVGPDFRWPTCEGASSLVTQRCDWEPELVRGRDEGEQGHRRMLSTKHRRRLDNRAGFLRVTGRRVGLESQADIDLHLAANIFWLSAGPRLSLPPPLSPTPSFSPIPSLSQPLSLSPTLSLPPHLSLPSPLSSTLSLRPPSLSHPLSFSYTHSLSQLAYSIHKAHGEKWIYWVCVRVYFDDLFLSRRYTFTWYCIFASNPYDLTPHWNIFFWICALFLNLCIEELK